MQMQIFSFCVICNKRIGLFESETWEYWESDGKHQNAWILKQSMTKYARYFQEDIAIVIPQIQHMVSMSVDINPCISCLKWIKDRAMRVQRRKCKSFSVKFFTQKVCNGAQTILITDVNLYEQVFHYVPLQKRSGMERKCNIIF